MLAGKKTQALANAEGATPDERATLRAVLAPAVEQLQHDLALMRRALEGPDPEFALSLLVDAVEALPGQMRALEASLTAASHLRIVA